jgi:hypothetical protein
LPDVLMGIKDMPVRFDKMVCLGKDHDGILGGGRRRLVAKGPRSTAKTDPEAAKNRPCLFDSRWLVAKAATTRPRKQIDHDPCRTSPRSVSCAVNIGD